MDAAAPPTPAAPSSSSSTVARRDIVAEYERRSARPPGVQAGLVDLATFNLANAVLAGAPSARRGAERARAGDWLLVHVAPDSRRWRSCAAAQLLLFRNRPADGEGSLADLVHQTAMYYEDRLGGRACRACSSRRAT